MGKKKKKKYYAIKKGIGVSNIIVGTWETCSKLVLGYNSVYKSFFTREEAEEYLGIGDVKKIKKQSKKSIDKKKIKKVTTKSLNIKIPKELYEDFEKKCEEFEVNKDKIIIGMIEEWLL